MTDRYMLTYSMEARIFIHTTGELDKLGDPIVDSISILPIGHAEFDEAEMTDGEGNSFPVDADMLDPDLIAWDGENWIFDPIAALPDGIVWVA